MLPPSQTIISDSHQNVADFSAVQLGHRYVIWTPPQVGLCGQHLVFSALSLRKQLVTGSIPIGEKKS